MLKTTTTTTINGQSIITSDAGEVTAATMNGSIREDGQINTNANIQNKALYVDHKEEVEKDIADFNTYMYSL